MIDVFYIAYLKNNLGWGLEPFKKFLASYEKYNAGIEHKLTILLRAFEDNNEDYNKIKEICKQKNIKTLDTVDVGLDFGAYLYGAKQSTAKYICCLNTSCEILCDDWLKKLYSPVIENEKYKMIGVYGSYELLQTYLLDTRSANSFIDHIKAAFNTVDPFRRLYRFIFTPLSNDFPNYAIRTSAFLVDKNIFLEYFKHYNLPKNKLEAYKTESGKSSITNFVLNTGNNICVVNKFGKKFDKENFYESETYRAKENNCIIKDRQQEKYENSNFLIKIYLRRICWGKF